MPRPFCLRRVEWTPRVTYFKPAGVPLRLLEEVTLTLDELEALRLADLEELYQEEAADRMKISRPTFGRIVESARRKVAGALVNGKALRLEGGPVMAAAPLAGSPRKEQPERCRRRSSHGTTHRHSTGPAPDLSGNVKGATGSDQGA